MFGNKQLKFSTWLTRQLQKIHRRHGEEEGGLYTWALAARLLTHYRTGDSDPLPEPIVAFFRQRGGRMGKVSILAWSNSIFDKAKKADSLDFLTQAILWSALNDDGRAQLCKALDECGVTGDFPKDEMGRARQMADDLRNRGLLDPANKS